MRTVLVLALVATVLMAPSSATASDLPAGVLSIEIVGDDPARITLGGRTYRGPLAFTLHSDGVAVTEHASIEQYLQGIAEMPFSWPSEALAAQAVAARTYLARTLLGGRSGDEARYGYDICATNRCQVYRGVQLVDGPSGDRWKLAVENTSGEVLIHGGRPIEAVYTAMVGSRSRANQDVWASSPVPYLQPASSPEIGIAPYAQWTVEVTARQFVEILKADGLNVGGDLIDIVVDDPPEGDGRTTLTVVTTDGTDSLLAPNLKGAFNRRGDDLYPGALPATLDSGKRLPEPLLSYTFEIRHDNAQIRTFDALLPFEDRVAAATVVIDGEGWGHGVGMSQWGARIMAEAGDTYDEILAHYYAGIVPTLAPAAVPEVVDVGLSWGDDELSVTIDGDATMLVNGVPSGPLAEGDWVIRTTSNGLDIRPVAPITGFDPITGRPWPR